MSSVIVPAAVLRGAVVAVVVCLPIALVSDLVVLVLIGFAVAGWVAGRAAPQYPYSNGAVAALVGFVAIQGAVVIDHLVDDESISWGKIVGSALLASGAGMTGGLLAERRARRGATS